MANELQHIIDSKRELLRRETISRSPINYSADMPSDQKDRYIRYLIEQQEEKDLELRAMKLAVEEFQSIHDGVAESLANLRKEMAEIRSELSSERSKRKAAEAPALNSVTPLLVPEEQLTKCAGYSQSLQSISYIVSPAVAALLYSVWDLNAIIAIDVLGAVIASITVAIVRIPKLGDRVQSLEPNFIREMKEGMAVLRQNKGLFALLLVGTLYMFVYMPINALYPLITMECFNGTPMHISITEIAYASGMLIGGLLLGLFGNYQKRILLITASIFMMGISLTISGLLPQSGFFIFVVCCAIMGLSVPFYSGVQTALFQEKIKPEYLGRVFSLTGSIMSLAMPIGLILSGFFADRIGVNHWFLLSGVLIIGIAIACPMITEVRKLDLKQNS